MNPTMLRTAEVMIWVALAAMLYLVVAQAVAVGRFYMSGWLDNAFRNKTNRQQKQRGRHNRKPRPLLSREQQQADRDAYLRDVDGGATRLLARCTTSAPLLGLAGTVLGIMLMLSVSGDDGDRSELLAGVGVALQSTFAGIVVAITAIAVRHVAERRLCRLYAEDTDDINRRLKVREVELANAKREREKSKLNYQFHVSRILPNNPLPGEGNLSKGMA